jgi:hypothetical protein
VGSFKINATVGSSFYKVVLAENDEWLLGWGYIEMGMTTEPQITSNFTVH